MLLACEINSIILQKGNSNKVKNYKSKKGWQCQKYQIKSSWNIYRQGASLLFFVETVSWKNYVGYTLSVNIPVTLISVLFGTAILLLHMDACFLLYVCSAAYYA